VLTQTDAEGSSSPSPPGALGGGGTASQHGGLRSPGRSRGLGMVVVYDRQRRRQGRK